MMGLTDTEMLTHIHSRKAAKLSELYGILFARWLWKATGEDAIIYDDTIEGVPYDYKTIKQRCKRGTLTSEQIDLVTEFFTGPNSEAYTNSMI